MARRVALATNERKRAPPATGPPTAAATACHATARAACERRWTTHRHPPAPAQGAAPPATTRATPAPAGTPRWRSRLLVPAPAAGAVLQGAPGSARSARRRMLGCARSARRPTAGQQACRHAPRRSVQEKNPSRPAARRWVDVEGRLAQSVHHSALPPRTVWTAPGAANDTHRYRAEDTATRSARPAASRHRAIRCSACHNRWPERGHWRVPGCLHATAPGAASRALVLSGLFAQAGATHTPPAQWRQGVPRHLQREKETGTAQTWKAREKIANTVWIYSITTFALR